MYCQYCGNKRTVSGNLVVCMGCFEVFGEVCGACDGYGEVPIEIKPEYYNANLLWTTLIGLEERNGQTVLTDCSRAVRCESCNGEGCI